eukprot:scaffold3263_cov110-Amphora_coffeaeformis.AAC.2
MMKASDEYDYEAHYATRPPTDDSASLAAPRQPGRKQKPPSGDEASVAGPMKPQRPADDVASVNPLKPPRRTWAPTEREESGGREQSYGDGLSLSTMSSYFVTTNNYEDESTVGAMTTDSNLVVYPVVRQLGQHQQQDGNDVEAPSSLADFDYSIYDLSVDDSNTEFENVDLRTGGPANAPSSRTDTQITNIQQTQKQPQGGDKKEAAKDQQGLVTKSQRKLRLIEQVLLLALIFIFTFLAVYFYARERL